MSLAEQIPDTHALIAQLAEHDYLAEEGLGPALADLLARARAVGLATQADTTARFEHLATT